MPTSRTLLVPMLCATIGLLGAGCRDADTRNRQALTSPPSGRGSEIAPSTDRTEPPDAATSADPSSTTNRKDQMRVNITIGDQLFHATLTDSPAARDLMAQLPVTIEMTDHGAVEKTGALPSPLSLQGQPEGADPDIGDLGYYAPGNDLVLYYGNQSYYPGIVILGRLESDAARRISELDGAVTATFTTDGG